MRIECYEKIDQGHGVQCADSVQLTFANRSRSRGKASTGTGDELAWFLERGEVLLDGNILKDERGGLYLVEAADEPVSVVTADSTQQLMRVAYHLGNRHLSLQVLEDRLVYQTDHVLDKMVTGLGASVTHEEIAFQPENGAYHGHDHE